MNFPHFISGLFSVLSVLWAGYLAAQDEQPQQFEREQALQVSQAAIGQLTGNYIFTDTQGRPKKLTAYRGKPLVVSMIFTRCFHICPTTTQHLNSVMEKAYEVLGESSFRVISIGFDTEHDTADAMRIFAQQQSVKDKNWDFLSANKETITALSKDLGFLFYPAGGGFDHLIQTSILDANGKVYRQVYGMNFATPHLIEPLKELIFGKPAATDSLLSQISKKIRLFCTVYDPANDRYRFDYSIFMGLLIGFMAGGFFVYWIVKEWRRHYAAQAGKQPG